eukprot:3004709-Rhodomonas_salina.1
MSLLCSCGYPLNSFVYPCCYAPTRVLRYARHDPRLCRYAVCGSDYSLWHYAVCGTEHRLLHHAVCGTEHRLLPYAVCGTEHRVWG